MLKAFIRKERDRRQLKKALAVKLLYQGHGYSSVVEILDVLLGAIYERKHLYKSSGLIGIRTAASRKERLLECRGESNGA